MIPPISDTRLKLDRLGKRIAKLVAEREALTRQLAQEEGFRPCGDCFNGYCSMNCSSAPLYIKVSDYV